MFPRLLLQVRGFKASETLLGIETQIAVFLRLQKQSP